MSHIIEPHKELNEISMQLAVVIEKVNSTNNKISELKDDIKEDIYIISDKIDNLNINHSTLKEKINNIENSQFSLESKVQEIEIKQKIIETRYNTIINIFKVGLPSSVAFVSLISGLVYLFKYLL